MSGKVFISMADKYKADAVGIAKQLTDMGYGVVATRGTAATLMAAGKCSCSCSITGPPCCYEATAHMVPPVLRAYCAHTVCAAQSKSSETLSLAVAMSYLQHV
jgi:AICAR transformylase/IMP cyclohydrolase PurH